MLALSRQSGLRRIAERFEIAEADVDLEPAAALPDAELAALLLKQLSDGQHAAGASRMSAWNAPCGVANPDLTVEGVPWLRVADASSMPM